MSGETVNAYMHRLLATLSPADQEAFCADVLTHGRGCMEFDANGTLRYVPLAEVAQRSIRARKSARRINRE